MLIKIFYKMFKKFFIILFIVFSCTSFFQVTEVKAEDTTTVYVATGKEASDMQVVLCNVLKFVTGGIGKTIASFIIIGVGIGFFTGKLSWGLLIGVTLGVSTLFGAPAIIRAVTGDKGEFCSNGGIN